MRVGRFKQFLDTFALTRARLWRGIGEACRACLTSSELTVAVAHFPSTFEGLTQSLDEHRIPFQISASRLSLDELAAWSQRCRGQVLVTLAAALPDPPIPTKRLAAPPVSVIVAERFPHPHPDQRLDHLFRKYPGPVRLGRYLATDDAVFRDAIPATLLTVIRQFGLDDHTLITSRVLSRRLEHVLAQRARHLAKWVDADSPEEWLALNAKTY